MCMCMCIYVYVYICACVYLICVYMHIQHASPVLFQPLLLKLLPSLTSSLPIPMKDLPLCFTQSYFAKMKYKVRTLSSVWGTHHAIFYLIPQLPEEFTADNDSEQTWSKLSKHMTWGLMNQHQGECPSQGGQRSEGSLKHNWCCLEAESLGKESVGEEFPGGWKWHVGGGSRE